MSSSGAKNSFSWIERTIAWWRWCVGVELLERGRAGPVAEPEHAGEVRASRGVGRQRVGLVLVDELQAVLDGAQPHVCLVEALARRRRVT